MNVKPASLPDVSNLGSTLSSAFNVEKIASGIGNQLQEITTKLQPLNILVVGTSSTCCLSLLKTIFGPRYFDRDHFCQFGSGIVRYQKEHHPLCIYLAELHSDSYTDLSGSLDLVHTCAQDAKTAFDLILYHLGDASGCVLDWEYRAMLQVSSQDDIPILAVLEPLASSSTLEHTQTFLDENSMVHHAAVCGTPDLCHQILNLLPETSTGNLKDKILPPSSARDTFIHLERLNYAVKEERIKRLISKASAATAAEAAVSPIPDWIVMAPTEAIMMAGINSYFEVTVSGRILKTLIPAVLGTGAATIAGKAASDVLGRVPFLTAAGAVVDAATARALTKLIGKSYFLLLLAIERHEISEDELASKASIHKLRQLIKRTNK